MAAVDLKMLAACSEYLQWCQFLCSSAKINTIGRLGAHDTGMDLTYYLRSLLKSLVWAMHADDVESAACQNQ